MSEKLIYTKITSIMKEINPIGKNNKTTDGPSYEFRGIDDVINELHSLFAEHEVFIMPIVHGSEIKERSSKNGNVIFQVFLDVEYQFTASDGSMVSCKVKGEAMDNSDKATNKAMSQALKYALMQMFLIPTAGKGDTEPDNNQVVPEKPLLTKNHPHYKAVIDKLIANKITINKIDEHYRVDPSTKSDLLEAKKFSKNDTYKPKGLNR